VRSLYEQNHHGEDPRSSTFPEQHPYCVLALFTLVSVVAILLALEISARILFPKINYVGESSSLLQSGKPCGSIVTRRRLGARPLIAAIRASPPTCARLLSQRRATTTT
jgi:hypothetical protein